ncbi:MAG: phosphoenolpyruvate--protein phosphotransferase [bacterium]
MSRNPSVLSGLAVSPGIAIGKAFLLEQEELRVCRTEITEGDVGAEIVRFQDAVERTRGQLQEIEGRIGREIGDEYGAIFAAHILMLNDPLLIDETIDTIRAERVRAECALSIVLEKLSESFASADNVYMRERELDIQDVGNRLIRNLMGGAKDVLSHLKDEVIIVARDIAPSDTAQMRREKVLAIVTDLGSRTSHAAIIARSIGIPAVVNLGSISKRVNSGDTVIVDGNEGRVIVNPSPDLLRKYEVLRRDFYAFERELLKDKNWEAATLDGHRIELAANIEFPDEINYVLEHGAEGVGLYRTEFLFINRESPPSEEEQYWAYYKVADTVHPFPVIIRTLDVGGDKIAYYRRGGEEANPFLGLRGIRLSLSEREFFKSQLRAILRASSLGNVKIMFPMVSGLEELREAKSILSEVMDELSRRGQPFKPDISVGVMIETPSAAIIAGLLAEEADFFSIGTNDLIQYTIAVDRLNKSVANLYQSLHPAVLVLIKGVVETAHEKGIWVGMCGEMAGDPLYTMLLVGLGLDELSMSAVSIPEVKRIIRSITYREARALTEEVLSIKDTSRATEYLRDVMNERFPSIFGGFRVGDTII